MHLARWYFWTFRGFLKLTLVNVGIFRDSPGEIRRGSHTISLNHSQSSNPESPDQCFAPWKVVTVGSKETSKVERKELRQLLFDLDQAIRNGLFQRKIVGLWRLGGSCRKSSSCGRNSWVLTNVPFLGGGVGYTSPFWSFTWRDGLPGS